MFEILFNVQLFFKLINCPNGNIGDPETILKRLKDEINLCWSREFFDNWYEPRGDDFQLFSDSLVEFKKSDINKKINKMK